jgi:hypothetical protein
MELTYQSCEFTFVCSAVYKFVNEEPTFEQIYTYDHNCHWNIMHNSWPTSAHTNLCIVHVATTYDA